MHTPINYTPLKTSYRRKRSSKLKTIFMCFVTLCIGILSYNLTTNMLMATRAGSSKHDTKPGRPFIFFGGYPTPTTSPLKVIVANQIKDVDGIVAVAIKNLKTEETYYLNEHTVFQSASLYKLWVMATVFDQIEKGTLKETETVEADVVKLNEKYDIATEEAEMKEGTISLTVASALNQMITISHNYAAYVLVNRVGLTNIKKFLAAHGLEESKVSNPPKTTAADIALFLEKLYNEELGSAQNRAKMIDLLKKQQINEVLPKYLPESTILGHKTGDLGEFAHDAGIIYANKGDYVIVLMSNSKYTPDAKEAMAKISESVFNYFEE
ncbi:hypothetical protein A3D80_01295 [Candidatus Roizmanbacteria bacterium RIFCSPHIGHO2_02_FULL_40_13b]|nr:MAG: hypothetical protein A3D80_01295 [Candidatus Roizmanbacteria bacterium RIFCSPHIGHO2_02_FULL_40_13b]OGK49133.1 MAG: hypothetical protein A3A56_00820 [Candidatus Roizmanbacteria bacterium RIFCSPLOWO2_01_FULL_40_32]OGK57346.1 MAG: hypothetical protein A3H83_01030 [Candidatus Roizmanbacteria bacterium RIFCSPLOWO2_02_FULL_39_8]